MEDIVVNKREFVRHFSKYLKEKGRFCLTVKDKMVATVEITNVAHTVATQSSKIRETPKAEPKIASGGTTYVGRHGCGCKKEDKLLCSKHGRY